jgi:hypothetical protein
MRYYETDSRYQYQHYLDVEKVKTGKAEFRFINQVEILKKKFPLEERPTNWAKGYKIYLEKVKIEKEAEEIFSLNPPHA